MPRIKRWFPVSHDINRDSEVWELCKEFGDRALRVWLEILSIGDRNDGNIPGWLAEPSPDLGRALADASRTTGQTVAKVSRRLMELSWIVPGKPARVANHWKYHRSQEREPEHKPIPPNLPSEPNLLKSKRATQYPESFEVSEEIKAWAKESGLSDPKTELEAFRDYHQAKGSTFKSWDAALRTWLRNAKKFAGNGRPTPDLAHSTVPVYKPIPAEPRPTKEQQAKVKVMLRELTEKIGNG